jgi:hypothetical protein
MVTLVAVLAVAGCGPTSTTPKAGNQTTPSSTGPATTPSQTESAEAGGPTLTAGCAILTDAEVAAAFGMTGLQSLELPSTHSGPTPVYSCLYVKGSRTVNVTVSVAPSGSTAADALAEETKGYEQVTPTTLGDAAALFVQTGVGVHLAVAKVSGSGSGCSTSTRPRPPCPRH